MFRSWALSDSPSIRSGVGASLGSAHRIRQNLGGEVDQVTGSASPFSAGFLSAFVRPQCVVNCSNITQSQTPTRTASPGLRGIGWNCRAGSPSHDRSTQFVRAADITCWNIETRLQMVYFVRYSPAKYAEVWRLPPWPMTNRPESRDRDGENPQGRMHPRLQ